MLWNHGHKLDFNGKNHKLTTELGMTNEILLTILFCELCHCISHYFRVQLFSRFWTKCGNSRVVNFAIFLMLSLL